MCIYGPAGSALEEQTPGLAPGYGCGQEHARVCLPVRPFLQVQQLGWPLGANCGLLTSERVIKPALNFLKTLVILPSLQLIQRLQMETQLLASKGKRGFREK